LAIALKRIPLSVSELGEPEAAAARRAILSGWTTMGPEVAAFETEFAAAVGARHASAVSSGTTALHLALKAAGVGPGSEVITASHSFIATASAIRYCGALPVFVDINPRTFNMEPDRTEAAITPKTSAILCVHQMGLPCDVAAFADLARRRGVPLVEDAACAAGSEILWDGRWRRIGSPHGDMACFSFHPRKVLSTGDGGMITTANEKWDRQIRLWRHHGMNVPAHARHVSDRVIWETYDELGYNYRMTDIQGAVGREQIRRLDGIVARRRALAARYTKLLASIPAVTPPFEPEWAHSNWQSYAVRLDARLDQRTVMQSLLDEGVATRRGVMCAHREPAYPEGTWRSGPGGLRHSEEAQDQCVILPLYPRMPEEDQEYVVNALRRACQRRHGAAC
jgi:dTDP-4-amino-4,6-dideoxygalactose transaminase